MKVYLIREKKNINAIGEYDLETKTLTVKKGSRVSEDIAYSEKFRGARAIERDREETVKDHIVTKDVQFKSASTAANFVTGSSTNGLVAWKADNGLTIKEIIASEETKNDRVGASN